MFHFEDFSQDAAIINITFCGGASERALHDVCSKQKNASL